MSRERAFAAEIIESGASALGRFAAERLFELAPETRTQFADGATETWKSHLSSRLVELAVAVRLGEPRLFVNRVLWARRAFVSRNVPVDYLATSLGALEEVLDRELTAEVSSFAAPYIEAARETLAREAVGPGMAGSGPGDGSGAAGGLAGELAVDEQTLRYLAAVLEGNARDAVDFLVSLVESGTHPREVISNVLVPAQREIGRMWHSADSDVAEEHLLTATTLRALSVLGTLGSVEANNGKTVVIASVQGNQHDIAVHALGIFFEWAGWKSIVLGANVPTVDLVRAVQYFGADLLVLSVALGTQLRAALRAVEAVRSIPEFQLPVLVGGPAFDDGDDLHIRIGADARASSLEAAVEQGLQLVTRTD
ncbi:MAG: cobalamin-dependent protein [Candidatus Eisenbacteria bacterium]|uniref:Cobalamin-dependent protein n=1 Tax=Eiseniibacteriota bacterium TaxID=2212470 RepID=A0A956N8F1_UNCEI|nr:cobalamin-dependent protein [Candidatus Eisenbacteria bacterium]MCB9463492.1 cobalamin B12-binding domain-containing protein [Candidatus Eisenbacteria bacterium]